MSLSLKDLADQLGVSPMTVSNALRGRGRMSEATREAVLKAAAESNYRPHASAKALRKGSFGTISLILGCGESTSTLPEEMLGGILTGLQRHELNLLVARLPDELLTNAGYVPRILREHSSDGLIINYTHKIPEEMIELIEGHHLPSIWTNVKRETDCVYPDEAEGVHRLTWHFTAQGVKRIAYVDLAHAKDLLPVSHFSVRDREEGYLLAMAEAELEPLVVRPPHLLSVTERRAYALSWLEQLAQPPEVVVSYGEDTPLYVLGAAARMGLRVPEDMIFAPVTGRLFNPLGASMPFLQVPEPAIGEAAAEMIVERISMEGTETLPARKIPMVLCAEPLKLDGFEV